MKKSRRKFSPEFKQEAVELTRRTGRSENQVIKELGIPQNAWTVGCGNHKGSPKARMGLRPRQKSGAYRWKWLPCRWNATS